MMAARCPGGTTQLGTLPRAGHSRNANVQLAHQLMSPLCYAEYRARIDLWTFTVNPDATVA